MPDQADDNVLSNRCKAVVRLGAAFLFGKELEITLGKTDPPDAQKFLNKIWGKKEKRIPLLLRLGMNGGMSGCAFLRIVVGLKGSYRLVELDPSTIYIQTAKQDYQTVLLYCIEYCCDEEDEYGKPQKVYYREEISRVDPQYNPDNQQDAFSAALDEDVTWVMMNWTQATQSGMQPKMDNWTPSGGPIPWSYPFPPIFHCQNMTRPNDAWGEPDIAQDLIGLNEALNLNLSSINRTEKIYGAPILYAPGMGETTIPIEPGRIASLPLPENKIEAVQITSDVANGLQFSDDLRSDMDELSGKPGIATGRMKLLPRGNVSGVALRLMFMSLLSQTDEKQCNYGDLIISVSMALLILEKYSEDIEVTLNWQSPLPNDDLAELQAAILKMQIGVSKATLMREKGYNPVEEALQVAAEAAQAALNNPVMQQQKPPTPGSPPGLQDPQDPSQQPDMQDPTTTGGKP